MIAKLVGRTGAVKGKDFTLPDTARVGADAKQSEIVLRAEGVSRRHARIYREGNDYWIEDSASTNGTFVNGLRIKKERIRHLDVITLGRNVDLIFVCKATQPGETPAADVSRGVISAALEALDGPEAGQSIDIPKGELTIGRATACNLVLDSVAVSKMHARIVRTQDQVTIEDLRSVNGTFVNGQRIAGATVLTNRDRIGFAGVRNFTAAIVRDPASAAASTGTSPGVPTPVFDQEWKTRLVWSAEELAEIEAARQKLAGTVGSVPPPPPAPAPAVKAPAAKPPAPPKAAAGAAPQPGQKPAAAPKPGTPAAAAKPPSPPAEKQPAAAQPAQKPAVAPKPGPPAAPKPAPPGEPAPGFPAPPAGAGLSPGMPAAPGAAPAVPRPDMAGQSEPQLPRVQAPASAKAEPAAAAAPPAAPASDIPAPTTLPPPPPDRRSGPQTVVSATERRAVAGETRPIRGVKLTGAFGTATFELGTFSIGRGPTANLRLDDREVSRTHAVMIVSPTSVSIEDQQSANGTFVNGAEIKTRQALATGDKVSVGNSEFTVELLR